MVAVVDLLVAVAVLEEVPLVDEVDEVHEVVILELKEAVLLAAWVRLTFSLLHSRLFAVTASRRSQIGCQVLLVGAALEDELSSVVVSMEVLEVLVGVVGPVAGWVDEDEE